MLHDVSNRAALPAGAPRPHSHLANNKRPLSLSSEADAPLSPVRRFASTSSLPPSSPSFGISSSSTAALDELASISALASDAPSPDAALESSTSRDPGLDTPHTLHLERGTVLYFGRKARKALPRSSRDVGYPTHVPVILPKAARNASRIHCSVRIVSREEQELDGRIEVEVRVTGQNGMKVDGKVKKTGTVVCAEKRAGEALRLRFWGWDAKVIVAESEIGLGGDDDEEEDEQDDRAYSRASSPAYNYSNDHGLSPQLGPVDLPSLPLPSSFASIERASALAESLGLDLPGLIASAIVFHSRSTVAVDEVIRALLKETGSMWTILSADDDVVERRKDTPQGEEDAVAAWRGLVEEVLAQEGMFGKIDNAGLKDASGHPIPPHYFYIPDQDPSPDRVAALEPFVKRVRGARSKAARYFWAKPSLRKNR
ncbi:hypothetical protein Rhopal_001195-T1 [Rhodotorula paludigena]|uniref:FHA domain-containing protein n=1 Tax=Rhodotorula paludigena TaxID=86838 RepID=A0AAV5GF10_9BASI|nr:hypothetical protein Rhopal_001195-T1 [Rhodotorula paludigena]